MTQINRRTSQKKDSFEELRKVYKWLEGDLCLKMSIKVRKIGREKGIIPLTIQNKH